MIAEQHAAFREAPLLSVVAVSRNDDHGGHMRARMQHFVDGFIAQCNRHRLDAELILVEWNPPAGRPPLERALQWPDELGVARVRVVTVPREIHAELPGAGKLPLFQMIGKNVGVRRARGKYVLATNVDILFDNAVMRYMRDHLRPGVMLRVDRYDVPADLPANASFDRVLAECARRFSYVNTRAGTFDIARREMVGVTSGLPAQLFAALLEARMFGPATGMRRLVRIVAQTLSEFAPAFASLCRRIARRAAHALRRFARRFTDISIKRFPRFRRRRLRAAARLLQRRLGRLAAAVMALPMQLRSFVRRAIGGRTSLILRLRRSADNTLQALEATFCLLFPNSRLARRSPSFRWLHTNACGDFTLLARDDWFRLRGYPEWPIHSWHLDSAFMYAAAAQGVVELALGSKYRIYHIDHSSGWSPGAGPKLFADLAARGIPYLRNEDLKAWHDAVVSDPSCAIVNDANWGMADRTLEERQITAGLVRHERARAAAPDLVEIR
jgi:hypothetical protein